MYPSEGYSRYVSIKVTWYVRECTYEYIVHRYPVLTSTESRSHGIPSSSFEEVPLVSHRSMTSGSWTPLSSSQSGNTKYETRNDTNVHNLQSNRDWQIYYYYHETKTLAILDHWCGRAILGVGGC
jgi:hypothetical protein